jgi:hypothetical protein
MLPSDLGFGQELIVIGPYILTGGFAAALLFALAAMLAAIARR